MISKETGWGFSRAGFLDLGKDLGFHLTRDGKPLEAK